MSGLLSSCFSNWKHSNKFASYIKVDRLNAKTWMNYAHKLFLSELSRQVAEKKYQPFEEILNCRRLEAKRSILVQVQSSHSYMELHKYCSSIGKVKNMFHYSTGIEPMHFIIVEFDKEEDVANILSESCYLDSNQVVPVHSSFLWFRAAQRKTPKLKQSEIPQICIEHGTRILKDFEINDALRKAADMSDQMCVLHNLTKLNEVGTRLRFLTAKQVEMAVIGMFPSAAALPFGSSVNGCGRMGCDLDLILRLTNVPKDNEHSRLVFHCKASSGSERSTSQRHMEAVGDLLQLFLPGCAQVRRILQARVPIIKYHQQLTDVECDLSMSNMSGVYMSDLLHIMGSLDYRVRPLIFTIRKWASEAGLTNSSPGRWITNFSLTLLVIAFLQKPFNSPPILPTLNKLVKLAGPEDIHITEDGINCTFLRDMNKLNHQTENTDNLEKLLKQFFEYYSQFDFTSKAVCINETVTLTKPEHSALYIVNPLERGLNVSKNVSIEEMERFKVELRNAAWTLEAQQNRDSNWGLLSLFENSRKVRQFSGYGIQQPGRLMEVSKLFEEDEEEKRKSLDDGVVYKNEDIKKQVQSIKRETRDSLRVIKNHEDKINIKEKHQR